MVGSIWFGPGTQFQGGIVATGGNSIDFLETKVENGEHIAYLPSCGVPFLAWRPKTGVIEILEVYYNLMLHAEGDIQFRFGQGGEERSVKKGKKTSLIRRNFRESSEREGFVRHHAAAPK